MTDMTQKLLTVYASFMPHMPQNNGCHVVCRRYRNRRIGEFLKELELTEGRSTGIPKSRLQKYRLTDKGRKLLEVEGTEVGK